MLAQLRAELGEANVALNGHPAARLPHNLNVSLRGIESRSLIVQLKNVALATGSACTTAKVEPSHVILALGFGEERAHSAVRIGLGRGNTLEDACYSVEVISSTIKEMLKLPQGRGNI